ncbi:hypothetical protein HJ588_12750 [Flexivirga sp. ID2601S]|uniref:Uncharacterized protein n=1 Tax=Flexivirga aerilata TaxID=1656889 RepID=A0A849AJF5_9MICO|nr:hypothetical protein [Flexivirga aerilata]NNG40133.1 hypothetical protein [Flexivirga aerilata]
MFWSLVALVVAVVVVVGFLRVIRPKLREQRHRAWERDGLLPHQVDPHAPRQDDDPDTRRP